MKKRIAFLTTAIVLCMSSPAIAISASSSQTQTKSAAKNQPSKKSVRAPRFAITSGFNPAMHGFTFANWQSGPLSEESSISLLIQLFGESSVCQAIAADNSCTPFPKAKEYARQFANTISLGRCEGMVVLASSMFGSGRQAAGLSKQEADANILYWWASQILPTVTAASESTKQLTPAQLLPLIASGISNGSSSTLGLYYQGLGHTVLPIKQVQNGNIVTVDVYDSNTPLVIQQVLFNTLKNSWSYTSVDASGSTIMQWSGSGSGSLDVIPMSARQPSATNYFSQ